MQTMTSGVSATEYLARWEAMKSTRFNWMIRWDEAARYIMPRKGNILTKFSPGQDQTINLYDSTAAEAAGIFAAGLVTHVVPPGEKWVRLEPKMKDPSEAVREWYDAVTDIVIDALYSSNFYLTIHEDFLDAGIFCTSAMLLEEGKKNLLNFINIPCGTYAIDENAEGMVDVVGREWKWTARQAAQKWGAGKLGKLQSDALKSKQASMWNKTFTYVHFIEPRDDADYQGGPVIGTKRPYRSIYICVEDQQIIAEDGYYTFPAFVSRLLRSNNEVYGRGPGMDVMPEIKLVNAMERDILTWTELMGNPPWLTPDDSSAVIDGRPGGVTYWDASQPQNKPEQQKLNNRVDLAEQKTEQKRERIRKAFYNDLFQMLTNMEEQKREKTAYEVQQMVAEKLLLFSPMFARLKVEKIDPMITRVVDIYARNGRLPEMPAELMQAGNAQYEVVITSKIALAIKAAENQSFATMMTLIEQAASIDPAALEVLKVVEGIRRVARNIGTPSALIRSEAEVQRRAAQRQQAAMAQQTAQTAETASAAVKNLGPEAQTQAARKIIAGAGKAA